MEGECERVFGSTFALQSYPEYPGFFRRCAVPWVPDFFHAPVDQGAPSGPPQNVGPSSRSLGHPLLLLARFPREGASAIRTRSGRLSAAPHHLRPSETLSTGRGASRRRPTSVAASGSSLPAALARRAPTAGSRPGGASTARPARSAGSGPCVPGPARAPLLAGLGSRLVRRCFQAPLSTVGLQLPVFPRVPFLACDLACLVCTVQIKVVSITSL